MKMKLLIHQAAHRKIVPIEILLERYLNVQLRNVTNCSISLIANLFPVTQ